MLKTIELTKECSQMRNEDAAHMTQSWWKQISQTNTCQWYSPSSWPDTSGFCSVWQDLSVSLNVIPQKCPAGCWTWAALAAPTPSCTRSVQRGMNTQGHVCCCQDDARCAHPQPFSQARSILGHTHGQWGVDWPLPPYKCRNQQKPSCFLWEVQSSWRKGNT